MILRPSLLVAFFNLDSVLGGAARLRCLRTAEAASPPGFKRFTHTNLLHTMMTAPMAGDYFDKKQADGFISELDSLGFLFDNIYFYYYASLIIYTIWYESGRK